MANQPNAGALKRMLGQTVVFNGKFAYGEQERLKDQTEAQQGIVKDELDATVTYLVLADISAGKTIQKKAASLNAKGAAIQVIDASAFGPMVAPTEGEVLALIRGESANAAAFAKITGSADMIPHAQSTAATVTGESFDGLDLSGFVFLTIGFSHCSFVGCNLAGVTFASAEYCDFTRARGESTRFNRCSNNRFREAHLAKAMFFHCPSGNDFTAAHLESATFGGAIRPNKPSVTGVYCNAVMPSARFQVTKFRSADFDGADLQQAVFHACEFENASFRNANLAHATLADAVMPKANLTGTNLTNANMNGCDLVGASLNGANLADCNLRGAKLDGVDLNKAKNYNPKSSAGGTAGPALTELDQVAGNSRLIKVSFKVRAGADDDGDEVAIDSRYLRYGSGLRLPPSLAAGRMHRGAKSSFADAMLQLANILGSRKVRFETVEVQSSKASKNTKELRELVMNSIAEAFNQPIPPADELAAAIKVVRAETKDQQAADRARREEAKLLAEKLKAKEKKQIAGKIAKEVGKVTDIATFLKALELRADKSKIDKATKMLKAERFKLFNDITDTHLAGVIKSQTDPDLVYACRIESDGQYACCTQNLNICGGLRGSICKHLLVLIIGLVKAGELDPGTIDAWVAKTHDTKPELNKETMGEIFIKYKGAEAGEVDWRPTETLPEDYYAL